MNYAGYPKELALIRKRGFAVRKDELIQGAVAIAAGFLDRSGQVAGCGKLLVSAAMDISKALGLRSTT